MAVPLGWHAPRLPAPARNHRNPRDHPSKFCQKFSQPGVCINTTCILILKSTSGGTGTGSTPAPGQPKTEGAAAERPRFSRVAHPCGTASHPLVDCLHYERCPRGHPRSKTARRPCRPAPPPMPPGCCWRTTSPPTVLTKCHGTLRPASCAPAAPGPWKCAAGPVQGRPGRWRQTAGPVQGQPGQRRQTARPEQGQQGRRSGYVWRATALQPRQCEGHAVHRMHLASIQWRGGAQCSLAMECMHASTHQLLLSAADAWARGGRACSHSFLLSAGSGRARRHHRPAICRHWCAGGAGLAAALAGGAVQLAGAPGALGLRESGGGGELQRSWPTQQGQRTSRTTTKQERIGEASKTGRA